MKITHDIWISPLKLGVRQSCKGCTGLVLRKGGHGNKPTFCTNHCRKRYNRKLQYLKNKEKELTLNKQYRLERKDYWNEKNKNYYTKRKERVNYKFNYLQSIAPLEERLELAKIIG